MVNSINNFYADAQPIVDGIKEYRDLLNSEEISNEVKLARQEYKAWTPEFHNAINEARKPQEFKKEELRKMSKDIWQKISESLENWDYWDLNTKVRDLIKNRIAKNLKNWDFAAIDFIVESMKNPVQYVIPEKEPSNPYWNN